MKKCRKGHLLTKDNIIEHYCAERGVRQHCKICYKFRQDKNNNLRSTDYHPTYEQAFWAKVNKTDTCWIWIASFKYKTYGYFRGRFAHIVAYELTKGLVPEGLELDHTCENPSCVNPDHLEPVTHLVNIRRYWQRRKANVL